MPTAGSRSWLFGPKFFVDNMLYKNLFGLVFVTLLMSQVVSAAGPAAVNLGSAGGYAILSKAGISTTGTTSIVGDIGVSPAAATYITGFGLTLNSSGTFALSSLVNGKVYAADYNAPTPAMMTQAVSDMQAAYVDAAGRTNPTATELGAGNIGGLTIAPGLYKWSTGVTIPANGVTLSGGPNDVWIFQISGNLNVSNTAAITLTGGAQPQNVFWQTTGQATLGTTSNFKGIILSQTAIVINTGATLNGRALAQTAVTLQADTLTAPTGSAATTTVATTTAPTTTPTTSIGGPITSPTTAPTTTVAATTTVPTTAVSTVPTTTVAVPTTIPTTAVSTAPTTTITGSTTPGSNSTPIALAVAAVVVIVAAGSYYYFKVMKKK